MSDDELWLIQYRFWNWLWLQNGFVRGARAEDHEDDAADDVPPEGWVS